MYASMAWWNHAATGWVCHIHLLRSVRQQWVMTAPWAHCKRPDRFANGAMPNWLRCGWTRWIRVQSHGAHRSGQNGGL